MKILVTGASGNVGRCVVEGLLKHGETVMTAGIDIDKHKNMFGESVEPVYFDFTDTNTYQEALSDVDRVFLMRPPHLGKPEDLYPFIDALKIKGIKLVAFLSLMGVEKNTIPPHHKIEKYIEEQNLPYAHIRPGFFMQNVSGIHSEEIRTSDEIYVPAGKSMTSFIDARDIGEATAHLLSNPDRYKNTTHTLTGPESLDYYQVADILSEVTGRKITYSKPGFLKYRHHYITNRHLDKTYVNVTVALYFMTRMGTAKQVTDDFFQLMGRKPSSFKSFAEVHKSLFMREEKKIC